MPGQVAPSMLGYIGRAGALVGLVALAILALLSGSDRQSRDFPSAPSLIGWPYDTGASRARAIVAFVQTGPGTAIGFARRAISSDPLSLQAVSVLGRSQLYAGQLLNARKTFEVAGQLGWRDPMTQIYWLDQALQGGDFKVAAERLDALLRQSPKDENRDKILALVSETAEGRAALAERLKLAPVWARPFLVDISRLSSNELAQRVDLLQRTGRGVWDCNATEAITQRLVDLQKLDQAQSVWRLNCASSSSLIYDGDFNEFDTLSQAAAFDWQTSSRGDSKIALNQDPSGNRILALEVGAAISLPVIRQLVVLKPGRYRLTWSTPDTPAVQARALRVSLSCKPDLSRAAEGTAVAGKPDSWTQEFAVDAECPARELIFWLAPKVPVRLDHVILDPY